MWERAEIMEWSHVRGLADVTTAGHPHGGKYGTLGVLQLGPGATWTPCIRADPAAVSTAQCTQLHPAMYTQLHTPEWLNTEAVSGPRYFACTIVLRIVAHLAVAR